MRAHRARVGLMVAVAVAAAASCAGRESNLDAPIGSSRTVVDAPATPSARPSGAPSHVAGVSPAPAVPAPPPDPCAAGAAALRRSECPRPSDWPPETQSLEVRALSHVLAEPRRRADYIGKVTRGTRVAWKRVLPAGDVPEGDVRTSRKTWG